MGVPVNRLWLLLSPG